MFGSFPAWLHIVATITLLLGGACALAIAADEFQRPQQMWIMNLVWPLTALFGSILWLALYVGWGRAPARPGEDQRPSSMAVMVAKGASHCGAGCTLGDVVAEWAGFAFPTVALWFGWQSVFAEKTFAIWIADFLLAFLFGVIFQYFTIAPMRHLGPSAGIKAALKADIASIAAWQVGMYGTMALLQFGWFAHAFGGIAPVNSPEFWFAMQLAMLGGFATSYPVNWWLIARGVKEKM